MNMKSFQDKFTGTGQCRLVEAWMSAVCKRAMSLGLNLRLKADIWTTVSIPGGCPQTHMRLLLNVPVNREALAFPFLITGGMPSR